MAGPRFPYALVVDAGTDEASVVAEFMDAREAEKATDELKDPASATVLAAADWWAEETRATASRTEKGLDPRPTPKPVPVKDAEPVVKGTIRTIRG